MVKKEYPIIKEVNLNNKSRKGKYYYVKLNKGGRGSYYKKKKGLDKEDYIYTKKHGLISKRKSVLKRKEIEPYVKKVRKRGKVDNLLGKGYHEYYISNLNKLTPYGIRTSYMSLLTDKQNNYKNPVQIDKKIAEILIRPENRKKWSNRIEYQINLVGEGGNLLATMSIAHKKKDLRDIKSELDSKLKIGMKISASGSPDFSKSLEGYNVSRLGSGTLKKINIKMIYRKGK